MAFVQHHDVSLHYERFLAQEDDAQTIVLLHGAGLDINSWERLIPLLNERYHVIAMDLRGHGESQSGEQPISWSLFVDDLHHVLQTLELHHVHLAGHGLGATVALKYSLLHESRVRSLLFMAIPGVTPKETVDRMMEVRKSMLVQGGMSMLAYQMAKNITMEPEDSPLFQAIVKAYNRVSVSFYFELFDLYVKEPAEEDFKYANLPVLSLVGDRDAMYMASFILTSAYYKNTRFLVVPGSANAVFIDRPALTAEWMHEFIERPPVADGQNIFLNAGGVEEFFNTTHRMFKEASNKSELRDTLNADFLSSFKVTVRGQERLEGWNQRYAKNLLFYLVFHPSTTREQVCDALFPDVPAKRARGNLKVYLNHLKKLLDVQDGQPPLLVMSKEGIVLTGRIRSDVLRLNAELDGLLMEEYGALKLRKGKKLLLSLPETLVPGLFDPWSVSFRESLEARIVRLCKELAAQLRKRGNAQDAVSFLEYALRYRPEDESMYDSIIAAYGDLKLHIEAGKWASRKHEQLAGDGIGL